MPFHFLNRFIKKTSYLGVDIGTTSIKIVEIKQGKQKPELVNYAFFETYDYLKRANTALQTSTLKLYDEEIATYLRTIIKKTRFNSRRAIISLPNFSAFTTIIDVPPMSESDLAKTLKFKVKQYIPLPLNSITVDWIKIGEKRVFLIAVPNEQIRKYKNIFQLAGLTPIALEVEGFSLARILAAVAKEPVLIIDIGSRSSTFMVARGGSLQFLNQSDFAGGSLTQSLSSGLNINIRRAEDLKRQKGIAGLSYGPERELSTLLLPLLDVIINEIKRTKDNYERNYKRKVASVVLSGGGAKLLGIRKYFEKELSMPVTKAHPFDQVVYPEKISPLIDDLGPTFAVAIGLGVKQFI